MENNKPRVIFLSHGGGPLPLLGDEDHKDMVDNLRAISTQLKKPSAILVISAHWEEEIPTITAGKRPSLIYDYYGFPKESYEIKYPCPGEPILAQKIHRLLNDKGIETRLDEQRGFDHGLFVPLKIMYPIADVPCLQLSLVQGLDPAKHIKMGAALAGLECENLLVIGSGFSFHNLHAFFAPISKDSNVMNESFEHWLIDTCTNSDLDGVERIHRLEQWEKAPFARYCHPREEHLLPLHVCYGLAQTACSEYFELHIMNRKASVYLW